MSSEQAQRSNANRQAADYLGEFLLREREIGRLRGMCVIGGRQKIWLSGRRSPDDLLRRLSEIEALVLRGPRGLRRLDSSWFWPGHDLPEVFLDVPDLFADDLPEVGTLVRVLRSLPDVTASAEPVWLEAERRRLAFADALEAV
jgi:hypothetical protein